MARSLELSKDLGTLVVVMWCDSHQKREDKHEDQYGQNERGHEHHAGNELNQYQQYGRDHQRVPCGVFPGF